MQKCLGDSQGVVVQCTSCGQQNRVKYGALDQHTRCGKCKNPIPMISSPIELGEEEAFEGITRDSALPVVLDFWADWCGPCKSMGRELTKFAEAQAGKIAVAKVNTEVVPSIAQRFGIAAIPTLVLFEGGREVSRAQGARSASQLNQFVEQAGIAAH
jgi:thioredoxin 2